MNKEVENLSELMMAIKASYILDTSKSVLLILLKHNRPLSLSEVSTHSGYSIHHVWGIMKRLIKHKLVKKYKRNIAVYTFDLKECNKFTKKEIPTWIGKVYNK